MKIADLQRILAGDFAKFIAYKTARMGFDPCARHMETGDFLQAPRRRKVVMGPRLWSSKTTIVRWLICWRWLRNRATKIIVISNTDDNAKAMTGAVHLDLKTDPVLRHLAPVQGKIGEYIFNVRGHTPEKGKSIRCAGLTTALTSDRADLIIIDDTESDKMPETRYELVIANFAESEALLFEQGRLYPGQECPEQEELQFLVVGQPHWEGSAYVVPDPDPVTGQEADHPLSNCEFLWLPAMINEQGEPDDSEATGRSNFPEVVSTERCLQKKGSVTRSKWRLEYQMDTTSRDADRAVVHLSRIKEISRVPHASIMVIDPADGGEAEWGIVIGGLIDTEIHVRDLFGVREDYFEKLREEMDEPDRDIMEMLWDHLFERAADNRVVQVYLEHELVSARRSCERYISSREMAVEVLTFTVRGNKCKRICSTVELPIKTGMISMEPHILMDRENVRQLRELRLKRLPSPCDRIDPFASLITILMEGPETGVVPTDQRKQPTTPILRSTEVVRLRPSFTVRPWTERIPKNPRRTLAGRR